MMKKILCLIFPCLILSAQEELILTPPPAPSEEQEIITKSDHSVPRESVPVEEIKFLIETPIPKTAHYLPFMQSLLNIKVGTLPNPIGVSLIASHTNERYKITKFKATLGTGIGKKISDQVKPKIPEFSNTIADTLYSFVKNNKAQIEKLIDDQFPNWYELAIRLALKGYLNSALQDNSPLLASFRENIQKILELTTQNLDQDIDSIIGAGESKEWGLHNASVRTQTSAIGLKSDIWLLPFLNLFATAAYLNVQQHTSIERATLHLNRPIPIVGLSEISIPVIVENELKGYVVMGGTNIAIGYKGFFASFMVSGGYVQLDDTLNNVKGFVQKPFMYLAPRIGYSYHGIFTTHVGVQRIELFGATKGKDLSKITGGLVSNYSVEVKKFPLNFLAGLQFMFMRDLGVSVEYVGSPDTNGLNAEIAYRF